MYSFTRVLLFIVVVLFIVEIIIRQKSDNTLQFVDVLTLPEVTVPPINPNHDNIGFTQGGQIMASGTINLSGQTIIGNATNIEKIQSVQLNFYAETFNESSYGVSVNLATLTIYTPEPYDIYNFTDNQKYPSPRFPNLQNYLPIGRNLSTAEPPQLDSHDLYITNRGILTQLFCDPSKSDGSLKTEFTFEIIWVARLLGDDATYLKRCRLTRFIINYSL